MWAASVASSRDLSSRDMAVSLLVTSSVTTE